MRGPFRRFTSLSRVIAPAATGLLMYGCTSEGSSEVASRRLLHTLLTDRFTAGRLIGQNAWQGCIVTDTSSLIPRVRCGPTLNLGTRHFDRIESAARAARQDARQDESTHVLRSEAVLELRFAESSPPRMDRAVRLLERARRLSSDDPIILNELAVAYLAIATRDQQLSPLLRALDAIERAVAADSLRREILFNRALILERLYLLASAGDAWKRYLAVERDPRWRAEAEAHAQGLGTAPEVSWDSLLRSPPVEVDTGTRTQILALVRRSPQQAREFGLPLLGNWGTALERSDTVRATRLLDLAREIGSAAVSLGLDRSVALAVGAIDAAPDTPNRSASLARAHVDLHRGWLLYSRDAFIDASQVLARAEEVFRTTGSPAARWAAFYRAASAVNSVNYAEGDQIFSRVMREAGSDEPALVGKTLWGMGLSQLRRGNYDTAAQLYHEAAPHVVRSREAENQGALEALIAEAYALSGRTRTGGTNALRALRLLSPIRQSRFLNNHLGILTFYARDEELRYAAAAVTGELVPVARGIRKPSTMTLALCARVRELVAVGRSAEAAGTLREALGWADSLPGGRGADRVRARVRLILGQLTRTHDPGAALPILIDAVDAYNSFGTDFYLPAALHEAALAAQAVGDPVRARRWLQQAMDHLERQQASFPSVDARATFYETVENVFDATIELELAADRPAAAFHALERGRIHPRSGLYSRAGAAHSPPAPLLEEVAASLPGDMLLIEYALLREQLVVWTASRRGTRHYTIQEPRDTVAALVNALVRDPSATDVSTRLFEILLQPLTAELRGIRQLTIVPDRELNQVPFAALRDPSGRYVMEGYSVGTVPSAGFFLAASQAPRPDMMRGGAVVVGDPRLDSALAASLPPLPGAAREAQSVADLYPRHVLLRGRQARRDSVLRFIPVHPVFHFAGHAVFNPEQPELSFLALATDGEDGDGKLHAWEIAGLGPSNIRVVVLSACSSLSPRASRTGPVSGLAYSFLQAGASETVSTLWDVNDGATSELMVWFHRHLGAGVPTAEALRRAQLQALRSTRSELRAPASWAAFVYTGP
jgi:CHAT domain-containing protein/tetratricopeptide (TPR) repeat protein